MPPDNDPFGVLDPNQQPPPSYAQPPSYTQPPVVYAPNGNLDPQTAALYGQGIQAGAQVLSDAMVFYGLIIVLIAYWLTHRK